MRNIGEAFAARLASGVTTLCACWRFERRDGQVFGATDHDREITFGGLAYRPAWGLSGTTLESAVDLSPGKAAAAGALDVDFLDETDLAAGLWDGARVDVWRVDWTEPSGRVCIWSGRFSEVGRLGSAFSVELVSLKTDFERPVGRIYSRSCDAEIGDARCRADLSLTAMRGEGVVSSTFSDKNFGATGLGDFDEGWFTAGLLVWSTGANAGQRQRVVRSGSGDIELAAAPRFAIVVGDAFVVTAGCDKSFATCGAKFANRDNFRGFPHMPGADAIFAGPAADAPNDGGRR